MEHIATSLENYSYKPLRKSETICVEGLERTNFNLCRIGIVPEGSSGRQVQGGPEVPGPWGFATTLPLVIDNHGGSARERELARKIRVGQPFTVEGLPGEWTFASPRRGRLDGDGARLVSVADYNSEEG